MGFWLCVAVALLSLFSAVANSLEYPEAWGMSESYPRVESDLQQETLDLGKSSFLHFFFSICVQHFFLQPRWTIFGRRRFVNLGKRAVSSRKFSTTCEAHRSVELCRHPEKEVFCYLIFFCDTINEHSGDAGLCSV